MITDQINGKLFDMQMTLELAVRLDKIQQKYNSMFGMVSSSMLKSFLIRDLPLMSILKGTTSETILRPINGS